MVNLTLLMFIGPGAGAIIGVIMVEFVISMPGSTGSIIIVLLTACIHVILVMGWKESLWDVQTASFW